MLCVYRGPGLCQHPVSGEVQKQGEERGLSPEHLGTVREGKSQMDQHKIME